MPHEPAVTALGLRRLGFDTPSDCRREAVWTLPCTSGKMHIGRLPCFENLKIRKKLLFERSALAGPLSPMLQGKFTAVSLCQTWESSLRL